MGNWPIKSAHEIIIYVNSYWYSSTQISHGPIMIVTCIVIVFDVSLLAEHQIFHNLNRKRSIQLFFRYLNIIWMPNLNLAGLTVLTQWLDHVWRISSYLVTFSFFILYKRNASSSLSFLVSQWPHLPWSQWIHLICCCLTGWFGCFFPP